MRITTPNKSSSQKKASSAVVLLIITVVAGTIFASPSLSMAQQQQQQQQQQTTTGTAPTTVAPTTAPLTPEEQQEQDRMQRTTTAITQNLEQGQKHVNGIVYTPRWSDPVWVQPDSLSMLFVYCLPGEFAESGQEILGGSELQVLESYSLAVTADLTGWLMIVENENENARLPAAVGVICASDANAVETRVLSPQEQVEINNIIKQFITIRNTVINNVTQIINIINNVTTNGTSCQLEITTNEKTYQSGGNDTVTINVTNDGNEALEFANSVFGLEIENLDTDELFPLLSAQVITTLEAGESRTFRFTYEELVSEIGTGTIEARVGGDGCLASTTFTLTNETTESLTVQPELDPLDGNTAPASYLFEARTSGGTEPYTYHWDFGDGRQSDRENVYHTYKNPGTYIITLTVTDATGQTASGSLSPLNIAPPTNDTGGGVQPEPLRAQLNLDSTDIPFTHRFEANGDGGTLPYTYHWDFGDGQEANVQNTRHTYENPGTYTATLTVTDATGQTASASTEVIVDPPSSSPPSPPTTGEPTTANVTGGQ